MRSDDILMKQIANEYVLRYGGELQDELRLLEETPGFEISEKNLERSVRSRIAKKKRRTYIPIISSLAAGLVVALLSVSLLSRLDFPRFPSFVGDAESSMAESDDHMAMARPTKSPADADAEQQGAEPQGPALPEAQTFDVIPLSVPLPHGFTQVGFEQDQGKSIYFVDDVYQDDIVMTLEIAEMPQDMFGFVEINLGGTVAYGMQTDSYCLLTFAVGDVLYTLTSEYDINTLLRLGVAFV